jgi:ribosomal protein S14
MVKDGTHLHVPVAERIAVYRTVLGLCRQYFPDSAVGVCKETHAVRRQLGLSRSCCNCMATASTCMPTVVALQH